MKKNISPEMYNYNKFPGPSFALVGEKVVSENIELQLVDNYRDAFDQTAFGQRFSQLMLKFDYIVGDWGNEQLRLKGFYKDDKAVKQDIKISHLEDYLMEYCNFGCAYFVLENPNPIELPEDIEERPARKRSRNRNRNRNNRKRKPNVSETEVLKAKPMKKADVPTSERVPKKDKRGKDIGKEDRHFKVTEKPGAGTKQKKTDQKRPSNRNRPKKAKAIESSENNRGFVIRQK